MVRSPAASTPPNDAQQRAHGIQRATLVAIATNSALALGQVVVGLLANAFSLVADAVHTLSDLFTDLLVLLAGKHGADPADRDHPYGHGRIETAATLILGAVLTAVGGGFLWASGNRLQNLDAVPELHQAALYMAIAALIIKELLFRYTLAASRRFNARVLEANAWHARSDAASSLVVAVGIAGSLAGYRFLEPLAAAVVGFMILNMGARIAWRAIRELVDTGLPPEEVARLNATVKSTPGVRDLHNLRTRRMADRVLCDTHVLVDPRITVSEGHRISDAVHTRIRSAHPDVRDVLVHIDAEDDDGLQVPPSGPLPERPEILGDIRALLALESSQPLRTQLHYLGGRVEVEVFLDNDTWKRVDVDALKSRMDELLSTHPQYRAITFFVQTAPQ